MKIEEIQIDSLSDSIDGLYTCANIALEEQLKMINNSEFQLYGDYDDLDPEKASVKYYTTSIRASHLGYACELFLKYLLFCAKYENNPRVTLEEIWNNKIWTNSDGKNKNIRMHEINELFKMIDIESPGFNDNAKAIMPLYADSILVIDNGIRVINFDEMREINPREFLLPNGISHFYTHESLITEPMNEYKNIFPDGRYAMENKIDVELSEIVIMAKFLAFISRMVRHNGNSVKNLDNNMYLRAMLDNPIIREDVLTIRTNEEINELLNMNVVKDDGSLLYLFLTVGEVPMDLIRTAASMSNDKESFCKAIYVLTDGDIEIENIDYEKKVR